MKKAGLGVVLLFTAALVLSLAAHAKEAGPTTAMRLSDGEASTGSYRWRARLSGVAPGGIDFAVVDTASGESAGATARALPVNLWILFDAAAVCGSRKADSMVAQAIEGAKRMLPQESLLSVVSFTQTTLEIHQENKSVAESGTPTLRCDPKLLSVSYDKPLQRLFERSQGSSLPLVVWVYSAGNLKASPATLQQLAARKAEVHLVLYNPFLDEEVRPVVEAARSVLGDRLQFSIRKDASAWLPDLRYEIELSAPVSWQGRSIEARVEGAHGAGKSVSAIVPLSIPRTAGGAFWERHRKWILPLAVGLILLGSGYGLYRAYRPRRCSSCGRLVRRREPHCHFCAAPDEGYLVGPEDAAAKERGVDVIPLTKGMTWLGSHRRSRVKFLRARGERRRVYAAVARERLPGGELRFRLVPTGAADVLVNGHRLTRDRLLGAGDEITIDRNSFTFITAKEVRRHG